VQADSVSGSELDILWIESGRRIFPVGRGGDGVVHNPIFRSHEYRNTGDVEINAKNG
jgi:hypothetical protein